MPLLVVSAAQFEAEPTLKMLRNRNVSVEAFTIGIGPIHTARSEHLLAAASKGKDVLYLGSCGSFYPFEGLHLITVDKAFWMPPCYRTGISDDLEGLYPPIDIVPGALALPVKKLLCTPTISLVDHFDPHIARTLPPRNELVENMELYVCARALIENARSLNVVLAVTNQVGPAGRKQWEANVSEAAELTASFVANAYL